MTKQYTGRWLVRLKNAYGCCYFDGKGVEEFAYSSRQKDALKLPSKTQARMAIQARIDHGLIGLDSIVFVRLYRMVP